jgi:MFS transporter, DHA3 family, macrolide efflux protein
MKASKTKYMELLKIQNYFCIWFGQALSNFGDMIFQAAYVWLAYKTTHSAGMAGFVIFASTAPYLFFGLIGGVFADRWNRKRVMIMGDIIRALAALFLFIIITFHAYNIWLLMLVAFLMGTVRCFFYPSLRATLTNILNSEQQQAGNAFLQLSYQLTKVIGYSLGGALITLVPISNLFFITFCTYTISYILLFKLKIGAVHKVKVKTNIINDLLETFRYIVLIKPLFLSIIMYGIGLLFITGTNRLSLPRVSEYVWHTGSQGFGEIISVLAIGNMLGAFIIGRFQIQSISRVVFIGWSLWSGFMALVGILPWFPVALFLAFLSGFFEACSDVPTVMLIQKHTPEKKLGQIFSAWSTTSFIGESGSTYMMAMLISKVGAFHSIFIGNIFVVIIALVFLILSSKMNTLQNQKERMVREIL